MSHTPILKLDQVSHRYPRSPGGQWALPEVTLSVEPGQVIVVRGESGSGKTTLLLASGGMRRPTHGVVRIQGLDFYRQASQRRHQMRAQDIGYLFQSLELVPYLTLQENVCLARGVAAAAAQAELERLGLTTLLHSKPRSVSHGQRQRAALARAMAHRPRLLIADEPTGNLDRRNSDTVFQALREFADAVHAVLLATHSDQADRIADQTLTLDSTSAHLTC